MKQLTLGDLILELTGGRCGRCAGGAGCACKRARARKRKSDTSSAAAESVERETPRLRALVFDAVRAAGREGATCDELEQCVHLRHQTCSARVNELRNEQRIVDSGERRLTRSGRMATVWVVP